MKPYQKIVAAILAVVLIVSTAGCVPMSLSKQWSYEYSDKAMSEKLDIGVYVYSLYQAYNSAKTYAEKAKGYKENEPFTDLKIKDSDGKKAIAKDWIKEEAEKNVLNLIAVDMLVAKHEATWDQATMSNAKSQSKDTWDMGPYASYGYYQPMKDELEKFGVSYDSFEYCTYTANVKQSALFEALYTNGGEKEVSDAQLAEFFTKNYVDYSYIPVSMYTSQKDKDGNETSVAFPKKKLNKTIADLEALASKITAGTVKFDDVKKTCKKDYSTEDSSVVAGKVETMESAKSSNADIAKALKAMKSGEAKVVTVGKENSAPIAYIVVKNDLSKQVKSYTKTGESNRASVLQEMKGEEFTDFVKKAAQDLKKSDALKINEGVINSYDAGMFYSKPEETTAAEDSDSEE